MTEAKEQNLVKEIGISDYPLFRTYDFMLDSLCNGPSKTRLKKTSAWTDGISGQSVQLKSNSATDIPVEDYIDWENGARGVETTWNHTPTFQISDNDFKIIPKPNEAFSVFFVMGVFSLNQSSGYFFLRDQLVSTSSTYGNCYSITIQSNNDLYLQGFRSFTPTPGKTYLGVISFDGVNQSRATVLEDGEIVFDTIRAFDYSAIKTDGMLCYLGRSGATSFYRIGTAHAILNDKAKQMWAIDKERFGL